MLTAPASTCEYERLFSELDDVFEPRRRKIGAQLLAAIRSWARRDFKISEEALAAYTDEETTSKYRVDNLDEPPPQWTQQTYNLKPSINSQLIRPKYSLQASQRLPMY
ncbi:hypothetical protein Ptr902_00433 [Pyrenophora tritici-repentis]|uniref:HAT C-terminal dimerisation domain-containing protein n=1 Tax=Pyrenophora tritici-repentis TaxID=45151 RepID=A0A317A2E3_9PLEO|nr:hypothetical protein A1F99_024800 [Pyrenophora tritici-repentis]KAF7578390.1 hypothetical protein PtrM4_026300 [Pyrenophora tritici-repentis]KAI1517915.1 hypothetical protein Ptr86124_003216 [Pyrenophora tritici-repentis]KAI1673667.1 hypothetical protein L13192_00414 [Pyrenophora tritici-repentis]KAI1689262.1 hypothetical protein KJE20_02440 [Pyrenophora tritici-repentis]